MVYENINEAFFKWLGRIYNSYKTVVTTREKDREFGY